MSGFPRGHIARVVLIFLLFYAVSRLHQNEENVLFVVAIALMGTVGILWGHWKTLLGLFFRMAGATGKTLVGRAKKVEQERTCAIEVDGKHCADPAAFFIVATIDDMGGSHDFFAGSGIRCCKNHHPFKSGTGHRGNLAHETSAMLQKRNLSIERIHMIERLY